MSDSGLHYVQFFLLRRQRSCWKRIYIGTTQHTRAECIVSKYPSDFQPQNPFLEIQASNSLWVCCGPSATRPGPYYSMHSVALKSSLQFPRWAAEIKPNPRSVLQSVSDRLGSPRSKWQERRLR